MARVGFRVNELRNTSVALAEMIEAQLREALLDVDTESDLSCSIVRAEDPLFACVSLRPGKAGGSVVFEVALDASAQDWTAAARRALGVDPRRRS
ncbi:MAG TPA: hypothetical protein VGQ78_02235 [Vicinamibacteria bacterium]|nr:hypothetical protein [Vicinamibacteria bacterium]